MFQARLFFRSPSLVTSSFSTRKVTPRAARFALQRLNLSVYFDRGDHVETLWGKSHCHFMSKTRAGSCNQDLLHRFLL